MAYYFLVAHWAAPLICLLINALVLKRPLRWLPLFLTSCVATYVALMLVVASQIIKDAFARQDIDASLVFGEGDGSDAGLALAPVLGIPVTFIWNAINFSAFAAIGYCVRLVYPQEAKHTEAAERALPD